MHNKIVFLPLLLQKYSKISELLRQEDKKVKTMLIFMDFPCLKV